MSRWNLAGGILALVLLAAAGCAHRGADAGSRRTAAHAALAAAAPDPTIRLLARLPDAVFDGPPALVVRDFPILNDDVREALAFAPPVAVRFPHLMLPAGARLAFGYGVDQRQPGVSPPVVFEADLDCGAGRVPVFFAPVELREQGRDEWREADVVLPAPPEGRPCDLVLRARGGRAGLSACWSWPTVLPGAPVGPAPDTGRADVRRIDLLELLPAADALAGAHGVRPQELAILQSNAIPFHKPAMLLPVGGALRWKLDLRPGDVLVGTFLAAVLPDGARDGVRATVAVRVRPWSTRATDADWRAAGESTLELPPPQTGPAASRLAVELPLPIAAAGRWQVEVALRGEPAEPAVLSGFTELRVVAREDVAPRPRDGGGLNVVVLLDDAQRADHLGLYGYARPTTPRLDAVAAAHGLVFDHAMTTAPWTLPAVASLFTGVYPDRHGAVDDQRSMLSSRWMTLADRFRQAGYATAAFSANPLIAPEHGFGGGFQEFRDCAVMDAARVRAQLEEWVHAHADRRFFAYAHFMETHQPYAPPDPFYDMFSPGYAGTIRRNTWTVAGGPDLQAMAAAATLGLAITVRDDLGETAQQFGPRVVVGAPLLRRLVDLYDGATRYWDDQLGRFLDFLSREGLDRDTLVVVLGDHGEEFGEHGTFAHGFGLDEDVLHVPLVLLDPALSAGRRVAVPVSLVDVQPILLERAGLPVPPDLDGRPLSRIEAPGGADRVLFAHTIRFVRTAPGETGEATIAACARRGASKLIAIPADPSWRGYRLDEDPAEQRPLDAAADPAWADLRTSLSRFLESFLATARTTTGLQAGAQQDVLRALGYVR